MYIYISIYIFLLDCIKLYKYIYFYTYTVLHLHGVNKFHYEIYTYTEYKSQTIYKQLYTPK
jgi:hypothetical protein